MRKSLTPQRLFSTDQFAVPLPEGHKFPIHKYSMVRKLLEREGQFQIESAPLANLETLELAHDPAYVQGFVQGRSRPRRCDALDFRGQKLWSNGRLLRSAEP